MIRQCVVDTHKQSDSQFIQSHVQVDSTLLEEEMETKAGDGEPTQSMQISTADQGTLRQWILVNAAPHGAGLRT